MIPLSARGADLLLIAQGGRLLERGGRGRGGGELGTGRVFRFGHKNLKMVQYFN